MRFFFIIGMFLAPGFALTQAPAPPQSASAAAPTFVPWQQEMALTISGEKAVYPRIAEMAHVEGCVYVSIVVSTDGLIRKAYRVGGPVLLSQSALIAAGTWKFKPSSQEVTTTVPVCFFLTGDTAQKLLKDYQKAAGKNPDAQHLTALARELLLVGSPDEAEKNFRQALSLKAGDPDAEFGLGDSLAVAGDFDATIAAYQRGLAITPRNSERRAQLAAWMEFRGDLGGALAQYRIILHDDPQSGAYRSNFAGLLLRKGDVDDAIEQYRQVLHENDNAPDHYGLGRAYEAKGDLADALKEYRKATTKMPQDQEFRDAYNRLAGQ